MKNLNMDAIYKEMAEAENELKEKDNKILEIVKSKVSNGVYLDILISIEMSENTYDYKLTKKSKGIFQIEEEFECLKGCYVNQTTNGGCVGDDFARTVSIEIGKNEYFEYNYWM